jgi:acetyltransferase-like isoleucine patch superfamily enzyme
MSRDFSGEHPVNFLFRLQRALMGRARGLFFRHLGFFAKGSGRELFFGSGVRFLNSRFLQLGDGVAFGNNARIECFAGESRNASGPKLRVGHGTTFGDGAHLGCVNDIEIGIDVLFGSYVLVVDHSHGKPRSDLGASVLVAPRMRPIVSKGTVRICDNVWIGDGVVVLPGAHIGEGAVIAANVIVRGAVEARTVYLGDSP